MDSKVYIGLFCQFFASNIEFRALESFQFGNLFIGTDAVDIDGVDA